MPSIIVNNYKNKWGDVIPAIASPDIDYIIRANPKYAANLMKPGSTKTC